MIASCAGVAASPWLKLPAKLIVKHRNEEGGLGIPVYSNACVGGDWIIQECLDNHADLAALLPGNAPLSTLRLVTASRACRREGAAAAASDISVLSCCWRAGRAGAATDHSSVLFDVDLASGEIGKGTSSAHWYQLGPAKAWRCPRISTGHTETHHPDSGVRVTGAEGRASGLDEAGRDRLASPPPERCSPSPRRPPSDPLRTPSRTCSRAPSDPP